MQSTSPCKGFCRAEDLSRIGCSRGFVAQWMLSRRGCFGAHRMLSRIGCCRAVDFVAQWDVVAHRMLVAQWIFLCTGYRSHCANYWFSGQLQDQFLTNWRGILKIPERFLSRTNQIIKTSLIFAKCVTDWEIRRNL
jgi:hypothetical protein